MKGASISPLQRRLPLLLTLAWLLVFSGTSPVEAEPSQTIDAIKANVNDLWIAAYPSVAKSRASAPTYRAPAYILWFSHTYGQEWRTSCGIGSTAGNDGGFYCNAADDERIYLDHDYATYWELNYGDYPPGLVLAHEWAHHIQNLMGWPYLWRQARYFAHFELQADCLAGIYTRWGEMSGVLNENAVQQAQRFVPSIGGSQPWWDEQAHGTGQDRLNWFNYGYSTYNLANCNRVFVAA